MSQSVLITGASSGFGNNIAQALLGAGHVVIASMRDVNGKNKSSAQSLSSVLGTCC